MPSRAKKVDREVAKLPSIAKELVNLFLSGPMTGEAINEAGIAFKKALIEASLNAELSRHLGYAPGSDKSDQVTNHRNASTSKTVLTGDGKVLIETPRDREGSFEPVLLAKHARRLTALRALPLNVKRDRPNTPVPQSPIAKTHQPSQRLRPTTSPAPQAPPITSIPPI